MDYIKVTEVKAYEWECTECGGNNLSEADEKVICDYCGKEFEVGEIE